MGERWYTEAVVYCLDVDTFADSDGDGFGDIRGLISRLDYLARLGVTCLWLNPIHPTPDRDDGYDVTDYYAIDPRIGSLGDFAELLHQADNRGIRILMDLVVNHTSDQHPWFQEARKDPKSPYRDWYVWSAQAPPDRHQGMVFPGEQSETWSYDKTAQAWYYHRFYQAMPDLNIANPQVREEIKRIVGFWLRLGVSGFRVDAAPFVIERTDPAHAEGPKDFDFLTDLRQHASWRRGDAVLLAEANVPPDELVRYVSTGGGGPEAVADRFQMLFAFLMNARLMLALARQDAEPVLDALATTPPLPTGAQWATFLRNHDEVDLSRLTADQRADVFAKFGPEPSMQLYGRGIRRRLAPMLDGGGDGGRRLRMAYSLQFTLPGTPVLRYGDEIGMGEDLALPDREAIRTVMQWSDARNAGFSTAAARRLFRPAIRTGPFGSDAVNVAAQRGVTGSLLTWFEQMIRTLRECPEVGTGTCTPVDRPLPRPVLAHRCTSPAGSLLFVHNLADEPVTVDVGPADGARVVELLTDAPDDVAPAPDLGHVALNGYGYRWFRLVSGLGF